MRIVETADGRVLLTCNPATSLDLLAEQYGADYVVLLADDIDPETFPMEAIDTAVAIMQKAEGVTSQ